MLSQRTGSVLIFLFYTFLLFLRHHTMKNIWIDTRVCVWVEWLRSSLSMMNNGVSWSQSLDGYVSFYRTNANDSWRFSFVIEESCAFNAAHVVLNFCWIIVAAERLVLDEQMTEPQIAKEAVLVASSKLPDDTPQVQGYDFNNGINYDQLLNSYVNSGFQATNFGKAVIEINKMVNTRILRQRSHFHSHIFHS